MKEASEDENLGDRLLHQAALWGNADLLADLLASEENVKFVNSTDASGRTPLHEAATNQNDACTRILLEAGANPNICTSSAAGLKTPLHIAAEMDHLASVELLVMNGADFVARDADGLTAADLAERNGHIAVFEVLKRAADEQESRRQQSFLDIWEAATTKDADKLRRLLEILGPEAPTIVNMTNTNAGCNTLLFKACEDGDVGIVNILLAHGADGRIHPVTKYSPLYIACYHGRSEIIKVLLEHAPELVRVATVEKWLPIHAATLNGHFHIMEQLLNHSYPSKLMQLFRDDSGKWEYQMAFDINARDVTEQSVLYIACCLGNLKFVEMLLKFKVWAHKSIVAAAAEDNSPESESPNSKPKNRIHSIMTRLNLVSGNEPPPTDIQISPLKLDLYCNNDTETALHVAVRKKHYAIAAALLKAGADPNLPIKASEEEERSTALVEACKNRDAQVIDLLLRHGARDDDCRALQVAQLDDRMISKLLALKAYKDPEFKVNKKALESIPMQGSIYAATLLVPSTPVMINWHQQRALKTISEQWLIDASIAQNIKLKLSPQSRIPALGAITRLDISSNNLTDLPDCLFTSMPSLHILTASQNKIACLPEFELKGAALFLEEMYLQDNRIEFLPPVYFHLPALHMLDLSNNKLQSLPVDLWRAPRLKDLNLSMNLLNELPCLVKTKSAGELSLELNASMSSQESLDVETVSVAPKDPYTIRELQYHTHWRGALDIVDSTIDDTMKHDRQCCIVNLNLSHNAFERIPPMLACNALHLARLSFSYNQLTTMGPVSAYPANLKHLDLSANKITSWFSQQNRGTDSPAIERCYTQGSSGGGPSNKASPKSHLPLKRHGIGLCPHRRHFRMENLRTLILANNKLAHIVIDYDGVTIDEEAKEAKEGEVVDCPSSVKAKVLFPSLSMLDISNNELSEVPATLSELQSLSVLNLSGNPGICHLPPQLGLLQKLWNLNLRGCSLQEPLRTMVESRKYKTMDITGYLKSILEDAKPYARMKLMIVGIHGIGKTSLLEQLRQEGTGSYRRKPPEHWAKRMGNKSINLKTPKGVILSTVGVDVGDWVYEKKVRGQSNYGPVIFRTWDFGGQREYYATHQYFLSKRSLYLVVWSITDGEQGVQSIHQWLINIQARAPNAPVIIVGTHYDLVKETFPSAYSEDLQHMIRERFINVVDADKLGLPRVLDTIEISCKTKHNVKLLCNLIYDVAFDLRCPGSKERLLEQKIPATYMALEDVVCYLSAERRLQNKDPVLSAEQYRLLVMHEMQHRFSISFRDLAELNQATAFLHDNGVLLHYEDATLKDMYFLDPQWLCDMLAHVVTIREINPFAKNGIMRIEDLKHVFKTSSCASSDSQSYIISLLNKFEVAMTWNGRTMLIPSLLPTEEQVRSGLPGTDVRVPVRSRIWHPRRTQPSISNSLIETASSAVDTAGVEGKQLSGADISAPQLPATDQQESVAKASPLQFISNPEHEHRRLIVLSYLPSGFWPRLITRMLADDLVVEALRSYFEIPREIQQDANVCAAMSRHAEWGCWQTGLELRYMGATVLRLSEVLSPQQRMLSAGGPDFLSAKLLAKYEGHWETIDTDGTVLLEIRLPRQRMRFEPQAINIEPCVECVTKLLSLAVDHIDTLLEDWYPTLGTRFVHTSEGKFLVTRLVPCPKCVGRLLEAESQLPPAPLSPSDDPDGDWRTYTRSESSESRSAAMRHLHRAARQSHRPRTISGDSLHQPSQQHLLFEPAMFGGRGSKDSGVWPDSRNSSRSASMEGAMAAVGEQFVMAPLRPKSPELPPVYCFMVEECILAAYESKVVVCEDHGSHHLTFLSPDMVFMDLGERYLIPAESMKRGRMLGRGAFGFVFRASMKQRGSGNYVDVAMKMLQPVDPGYCASHSDTIAYKAAANKWQRDPLQYACKAYCTARQELNILMTLKHSHIVPLVGVCVQPLALVLSLAPRGSLDVILRDYRRSGAHLDLFSIQKVVLQVAKALEYLHQQHIIYRDLKSENVLVWEFPPPFYDVNTKLLSPGAIASAASVFVKLADYGISRATLPTGTKGFGGTEGFMAPEIIRHNGEEEYTEKVDCFSFGMFMYELLTLRLPFEGMDCVKDHVLDGGRPVLTNREVNYPDYFLDLMIACWSQQPKDRPSASQIVSIASAPEFVHLLDVSSVPSSNPYLCSVATLVCANGNAPPGTPTTAALRTSGVNDDDDDYGGCDNDDEMRQEVWISRPTDEMQILVADGKHWKQLKCLPTKETVVTCATLVNNRLWLGDVHSNIRIYDYMTYEMVSQFALRGDSDSDGEEEAVPSPSSGGQHHLDLSPASAAVHSIAHARRSGRVAMATKSGRVWLCAESGPNGDPQWAPQEIGLSVQSVLCLGTIEVSNDRFELWCGCDKGAMVVNSIRHQTVLGGQTVLNHFNDDDISVRETHDVTALCTTPGKQLAWSYVYPGCVVYQWDCTNKRVAHKLDCSKLVPCSESLMSISIEEHFSPGRCQVTAMCVHENELYVGTTWGCVVVADALSLRPVTVFRPYEEEVKALLPVPSSPIDTAAPFTNSRDTTQGRKRPPLLVSIGRGYRNLIGRYLSIGVDTTPTTNTFCILWAANRWDDF